MHICLVGQDRAAVEILFFLASNFGRHRLSVLRDFGDAEEETSQPTLSRSAQSLGVAVFTEPELYSCKNLVLIEVGSSSRVSANRFHSTSLYRVHYSLLPKYRGHNSAVWPILNGDLVSGVTLHHIDGGLDTGNIVDQCEFYVALDSTALDLYRACMECATQIFRKNIKAILAGPPPSTIQSFHGSSYYPIDSLKAGGQELRLNVTAWQVVNQVRAYAFGDNFFPVMRGRRISGATVLQRKSSWTPGTVLSENNEYLEIATADFDVQLRNFDSLLNP